MAEIFISYAREDVVRAHQLCVAFGTLGWSVWWDDQIRAGTPFDAVIDQQLDSARCVVVVWSTASVNSGWVRSEAYAAVEQNKLLPVTFETRLRFPVQFRHLAVIYLAGTDLAQPTEANLKLVAGIAQLTGRTPHGLDPRLLQQRLGQTTSAALQVTSGMWRITIKVLGITAQYLLDLHPNGMVTGTGKWSFAGADLTGRWVYSPATQILHLELSGGIQEGTKAILVKIARWRSPDVADCTFDGRRAELARMYPAAPPGHR